MVDCIEIDFLPVGDGEHSGDAIVVRWQEDGQYKIMIYDGGTKAYGAAIVEHVKEHFHSDYIDYVVNSHPDNDHAGGLLYVLENMEVGQLWMHRPWKYSAEIRDYFYDGRMTDDSLAERLKKKMSAAYALESAAENRNISIYEPFAGNKIGVFTILSPSRDQYVHELVPEFEKSPELKKEESVVASIFNMFKEAAGYIADLWDEEYLPDTVSTSAENESSAVLFASVGTRGYLLTGDAGIKALRASANYATSIGIDLPQEVTFIQIPHHGGRHNISTEVLNMLVGKPLQHQAENPVRTAYVSVAAKAPRHPKKVVTNAFVRRGFNVGQTKGSAICHLTPGTTQREGWGPITYLPFYEEVER